MIEHVDLDVGDFDHEYRQEANDMGAPRNFITTRKNVRYAMAYLDRAVKEERFARLLESPRKAKAAEKALVKLDAFISLDYPADSPNWRKVSLEPVKEWIERFMSEEGRTKMRSAVEQRLHAEKHDMKPMKLRKKTLIMIDKWKRKNAANCRSRDDVIESMFDRIKYLESELKRKS